MDTSLSDREFKLMQKFIEKRCGIALGEEKAYLIETRLSKLLIDSGLNSFEELYLKIVSNNDPETEEKVIDAITTNETMWFRDGNPWDIMENVFLPDAINQIKNGMKKRVRVWSAACSTGQEPYSIAMCIDNYLNKNAITDISLSNFEILATDISGTVLKVARMGKYDSISIMRGLSESYKTKYFSNEGRVWSLSEKIRDAVNFKQFNLQNSFLPLGMFDMIFCRYVIIYFSNNFKQDMIKKLSASLEKGGLMVIGSSEILFDYKEYFDLCEYKNSVYYKVKG